MPCGLLGTDLYQFAMMQAYLRAGMTGPAAFEMFVRRLPSGRNFLVAAGLEQCLDFLESLSATPAELEWLKANGGFDDAVLNYLATLRFTGEVEALPEGTVFFADEPMIRVTAPLPVAQLVETRLINILHFQTVIASKAARVRLAAGSRLLVDFGYRRAHGAEAGLLAARAAYLAGFDGTATVEAGRSFGIPLYGTMAHSFIQAHDNEEQAFLDFARTRPDRLVLLVDTYDTERGALKAAEVARRLANEGITLHGVRLDSGDLGAHAHAVRAILDAQGLGHVTVFASGGLDEAEIARLCAEGAPIDGFGVGTSLTTSSDAPALDCAYKLQEYAGLARRKTSEGKSTWPGRKQVFRTSEDGAFFRDDLGLADEPLPGHPLLRRVMAGGRRLAAPPGLGASRDHARDQLARLPDAVKRLDASAAYPVVPSAGLRRLAAQVDRRLAAALTPAAEARWEHFPHGADIGIRGIGPSLESALEQAALALTAAITDPAGIVQAEEADFSCRGADTDALLYQWLNALIYEMAVGRRLFSRFEVMVEGECLRGRAWGEALDVARHQPAVEPKGATYTELAVHRVGSAWTAQCVVDV